MCMRALLLNRLEKREKAVLPLPKKRRWRLSTVGITTMVVVVACILPSVGLKASAPWTARHNPEKRCKVIAKAEKGHAFGVVFPSRHTRWLNSVVRWMESKLARVQVLSEYHSTCIWLQKQCRWVTQTYQRWDSKSTSGCVCCVPELKNCVDIKKCEKKYLMMFSPGKTKPVNFAETSTNSHTY